jgi:hypothetical protein
LAAAHGEVIAKLCANADVAAAIARCQALAEAVDPGLLGFYEAIAGRRDDFKH